MCLYFCIGFERCFSKNKLFLKNISNFFNIVTVVRENNEKARIRIHIWFKTIIFSLLPVARSLFWSKLEIISKFPLPLFCASFIQLLV